MVASGLKLFGRNVVNIVIVESDQRTIVALCGLCIGPILLLITTNSLRQKQKKSSLGIFLNIPEQLSV